MAHASFLRFTLRSPSALFLRKASANGFCIDGFFILILSYLKLITKSRRFDRGVFVPAQPSGRPRQAIGRFFSRWEKSRRLHRALWMPLLLFTIFHRHLTAPHMAL
jgi:hypothetical protein